jgi:hypothetical protein
VKKRAQSDSKAVRAVVITNGPDNGNMQIATAAGGAFLLNQG